MYRRELFYIAGGYLLGSVLFALVFGRLLCHKDITLESADKNPGTANAFRYGGFYCGVLTLCADLLKGFLPVWLYLRQSGQPGAAWLALVLAAPVVGHTFPLYSGFRGGKGIATTFGCLLGLLPAFEPAALLAVTFIFFSLVLRITPHYHRTICTYLCTAALLLRAGARPGVALGFFLMGLAVLVRMLKSPEEKDNMKVSFLWKR